VGMAPEAIPSLMAQHLVEPRTRAAKGLIATCRFYRLMSLVLRGDFGLALLAGEDFEDELGR
jgi:hypothetical protein